MSGGSESEREARALDALLVWALRQEGKEGDEVDPKRLPKLTEEERTALSALGTNFVQRLLAGEKPVRSKAAELKHKTEEQYDLCEPALAGSNSGCGLNRAEEIDAETAEELERKKREILERKARERKESGGGGD